MAFKRQSGARARGNLRSKIVAFVMESSPGFGKAEVACRVCGDKASGKHYGVPSCDGCRGFFKRSIRRNLDYVCKENSRCIVDVTRRNQCQACRFSKCLRVNMKKDAVQHERAPRTCLPSHSPATAAAVASNFSGLSYGQNRRLTLPVHASPLAISSSLQFSMPSNRTTLIAPFPTMSSIPVFPNNISSVNNTAAELNLAHTAIIPQELNSHLPAFSLPQTNSFSHPSSLGPSISLGFNALFGANALKNTANIEMNALSGLKCNGIVSGHLPYALGESTYFPGGIFYPPAVNHLVTRNFANGHLLNESMVSKKSSPRNTMELELHDIRADSTAKEDEVTSSEETIKPRKESSKLNIGQDSLPEPSYGIIDSSETNKREEHNPHIFYGTMHNSQLFKISKIQQNIDKKQNEKEARSDLGHSKPSNLYEIPKQPNMKRSPQIQPGNSLSLDKRDESEDLTSLGENIHESSAKLLFLSVKWAKTIPAFLQLESLQQEVLLSSTWKELFILTAAQCALPPVSEQLRKDNGLAELPLEDDARRLDALIKRMESMNIDHSEYAFLKAVVLFQPDTATSAIKHQIEMLQDQTLMMLLDYCLRYKSPTRASRLLLMLPSVICLAKHGRIEELLFKDTVGNIAIENILSEIDTYKQQ